MVPGFRLDSVLTNFPIPIPSELLELSIVGLREVFQQTPLPRIVVPPSSKIFPPEDAEEVVTFPASVVVKVGGTSLLMGTHPQKKADRKNNQMKEFVRLTDFLFMAISIWCNLLKVKSLITFFQIISPQFGAKFTRMHAKKSKE